MGVPGLSEVLGEVPAGAVPGEVSGFSWRFLLESLVLNLILDSGVGHRLLAYKFCFSKAFCFPFLLFSALFSNFDFRHSSFHIFALTF